MPPLADPDIVLQGPFIAPPPGATYGGQPSPSEVVDPLTGARLNPNLPEWMSAPPSWVTNSQVPSWMTQQQQQQPPPSSAQSWSYGQHPPLTPLSPWTAPTPPGSWGPSTPPGSWSPPTPASANTNGANWVQQGQQGYYTPFGQESSVGQPISASPWFGGGDGLPGPGGGVSGVGGPSRKRSTRQSRRSTPDPKQQQYYQQYAMMQNPYPNPQIMPVQRTMSHELPGTIGYPVQRSTSVGGSARFGYTMAASGYPQMQMQMKLEEYSARNLARRPRDWRPDYDSRAGLASYIPRVGRHQSDVTEWNDPIKRVLCDLLSYKPSPPIFLDLRIHPLHPTSSTLEFPHLLRRHNDLDFAQLATSPPAPELRLYHPRLPWYIDIVQSHTNGVTVYDVLVQMFQQLDLPITGKHWWNEEIDDVLRGKMTAAFHGRTAGNGDEVARGVKRVDFLRGRYIFEGLVKGRNGMWEMRTRKMEGDRQAFSGW